MDGYAQYEEAERLADAYKEAIQEAEHMPHGNIQQADERYLAAANARALLDKAQVHATLAVADFLRAMVDRNSSMNNNNIGAL